jgi:hypothetical protein
MEGSHDPRRCYECTCSICGETFLGKAKQFRGPRPICPTCWNQPHAEWRGKMLTCSECGRRFPASRYKWRRFRQGHPVHCTMQCARKCAQTTKEMRGPYPPKVTRVIGMDRTRRFNLPLHMQSAEMCPLM